MQLVPLIWSHLEEYVETERLFRTVGISFSNLKDSRIRQLNLFEEPLVNKRERIEEYLDRIRHKYGKDVVMRATSLSNAGTLKTRKDLVVGHKAYLILSSF